MFCRYTSGGGLTFGEGAQARKLLRLYYEIDEDESKHALALEKSEEYGRREAPNAWVLLEEL